MSYVIALVSVLCCWLAIRGKVPWPIMCKHRLAYIFQQIGVWAALIGLAAFAPLLLWIKPEQPGPLSMDEIAAIVLWACVFFAGVPCFVISQKLSPSGDWY